MWEELDMKVQVNHNSLVIGPFGGSREIATIDVRVDDGAHKLEFTMPFFKSSGRNAGKIKGEWYPIMGVWWISHLEQGKISKYVQKITEMSAGNINNLDDGC